MTRLDSSTLLPAILGNLHQNRAEGILLLEQNDGNRRIHWAEGNVIYLQSDVAGEQFGNYLLRQGILDYSALSELLANDERFRLGEKVIQWGLMTEQERDLHLSSLQEQVMIHALEHPIIHMDWKPGRASRQLSDDLHFQVNHRHFIWHTFQEACFGDALCDLLYQEQDWRWSAEADLLEAVSDLPLTPPLAYAVSFLGRDPMGFETFLSLSSLEDDAAARLLMTLWAIGGLVLAAGEAPGPRSSEPAAPLDAAPPPPVVPVPPPTPLVPAPTPAPMPTQDGPPALEFLPRIELVEEPTAPAFPSFSEIPALPVVDPSRSEETPSAKARKFTLRAKHLLSQDRMVEAIRLLEQSVQLDPDSEQSYEPWLLLGKHRMVNPAWSTRAIEALQAAARIRPKNAEPWALMGEVYHRKGFQANARVCYRKAVDLDPTVPVPDDLSLRDEAAPPPAEAGGGLFSRFRSILGGKE